MYTWRKLTGGVVAKALADMSAKKVFFGRLPLPVIFQVNVLFQSLHNSSINKLITIYENVCNWT